MMNYFMGIDVSKSTLDVALIKGDEVLLEIKILNQSKAIGQLIKELKNLHVPIEDLVVCLEHTGIYCLIALESFHKKGIKICLERALQIKQSQGMTRGKSDKLDARRIALYALKNQQELTFWKPQRPIIQKLRMLLSIRERLVRSRVQLGMPAQEAKGFVEKSLVRELQRSTRKVLRTIQAEIKTVENRLMQLLTEDSTLKEQFKQVTSVPGVGPVTALHMIVSTNEFTRITEAKKFACYAGVAPFEHSSGSSIRGKTRVSKMANMTIKKLLHLAAMSAIKTCEETRTFYLRKVADGKNKMSVINAVRNKLISRVFACVREQREYQKIYKHALA